MADIFISYAREDLEIAKALSEILEQDGWSVWWDCNIGIGMQFSRVIERELASARCVLVIWSQSSCESQWVYAEASDGHQRGVLIPVKKDDCHIPFPFGQIQTADLTAWRQGITKEPELVKIRDSIRTLFDQTSIPIPKSYPTRFEDTRTLVPYIDINLSASSKIKENQLPTDAEVTGDLNLFGFSHGPIFWDKLIEGFSANDRRWTLELGRVMQRTKLGRVGTPLEQRFFADDDRVYQPILYYIKGLSKEAQTFRILFIEVFDQRGRFLSALPPILSTIQLLIDRTLEFQYLVIKPYLISLNALKDVEHMYEAADELNSKIEEFSNATLEAFLLTGKKPISSINEISDLFSVEACEKLLFIERSFTDIFQRLQVEIESRDLRALWHSLNELNDLNKSFLKLLVDSYRNALD